MANNYGNGITIQRTGVATWVVYRKGVNVSGNLTSATDAESLASGLISAAAQLDRIGNRKTAVGDVQVVTMGSFAGTDSFALVYKDNETIPFVRGTNAAASDLQAALRTLTGDSTLTVTGTTDAGPYTVTFVSSTVAQPLLQQGTVSACTATITRTTNGGTGF